MPRPRNIGKMLALMTPAQIEQLRELLREDPRVAKLEKKLAALDEKRESILAEIDALKGGKSAGKKPGRPRKAASKPVGQRRRGKAGNEAESSGKRGVSTPKKRMEAAKAAAKKARTPEERAKIAERMAKARAARGRKG